MEKIYIVNIYFGNHKTEVRTKEFDFFRWIDNLSEEFEISKENRKIKDDKEKREIDVLEYYITDYYDEKTLVGTLLRY